MNAETPLAFHRRRIAALSATVGAWMQCPNASCRRTGACRRAGDVFPACLLPIVRDVNKSVAACAAALPGQAPRDEEESLDAQIRRINRRVANLIEREIDKAEGSRRKTESSWPGLSSQVA